MTLPKDKLYAHPQERVADFIFDEQVAQVFEDMIQRSVPGYAAIINMIGVLAGQYARAGTRCYDLGCSLGAATIAMGKGIQARDVVITAVDNSEAMVAKCRDALSQIKLTPRVDLVCDDIRNVVVQNASMAVFNFTLQFIPIKERESLLARVYAGLNKGGILIISDKIAFDDKQEEMVQAELHHTFKRLNGYSDLEIAQKRTALEKVLIPDTLAVHHQRLAAVGFKKCHVWFRCFNFASILAVK